jgi:hypothetical protein
VGALLVVCAVARAQVWGYVDEQGVAHFAAEKMDVRYELFYRGDKPPASSASSTASALPVPAVLGARPAQEAASSSGWETDFLMGKALPEGGEVMAPAELLAFFQVSPAYKAVRHHIRAAARLNGLPPELLQAMIAAESGFDAQAVSPRGAVGLMQIMPLTAAAHGLSERPSRSLEQQLTDPRTNIFTGARILARLRSLFPNRLELVLAAYNAGEGSVRRAGRQVPPIPETLKYVQTVMQLYDYLQPPRALQQRNRLTSGQRWCGALVSPGAPREPVPDVSPECALSRYGAFLP